MSCDDDEVDSYRQRRGAAESHQSALQSSREPKLPNGKVEAEGGQVNRDARYVVHYRPVRSGARYNCSSSFSSILARLHILRASPYHTSGLKSACLGMSISSCTWMAIVQMDSQAR